MLTILQQYCEHVQEYKGNPDFAYTALLYGTRIYIAKNDSGEYIFVMDPYTLSKKEEQPLFFDKIENTKIQNTKNLYNILSYIHTYITTHEKNKDAWKSFGSRISKREKQAFG